MPTGGSFTALTVMLTVVSCYRRYHRWPEGGAARAVVVLGRHVVAGSSRAAERAVARSIDDGVGQGAALDVRGAEGNVLGTPSAVVTDWLFATRL